MPVRACMCVYVRVHRPCVCVCVCVCVQALCVGWLLLQPASFRCPAPSKFHAVLHVHLRVRTQALWRDFTAHCPPTPCHLSAAITLLEHMVADELLRPHWRWWSFPTQHPAAVTSLNTVWFRSAPRSSVLSGLHAPSLATPCVAFHVPQRCLVLVPQHYAALVPQHCMALVPRHCVVEVSIVWFRGGGRANKHLMGQVKGMCTYHTCAGKHLVGQVKGMCTYHTCVDGAHEVTLELTCAR